MLLLLLLCWLPVADEMATETVLVSLAARDCMSKRRGRQDVERLDCLTVSPRRVPATHDPSKGYHSRKGMACDPAVL